MSSITTIVISVLIGGLFLTGMYEFANSFQKQYGGVTPENKFKDPTGNLSSIVNNITVNVNKMGQDIQTYSFAGVVVGGALLLINIGGFILEIPSVINGFVTSLTKGTFLVNIPTWFTTVISIIIIIVIVMKVAAWATNRGEI